MGSVAEGVPRADVFRLTVNLRFLTTSDGGRMGPAFSGYRPPCWFGLHGDNGEKLYSDGALYFHDGADAYRDDDGLLCVAPGGSCRADVVVISPEYVRPLASPGSVFEVWDGRTVGVGTVETVFDPEPASD
jgi:hypothetical protein